MKTARAAVHEPQAAVRVVERREKEWCAYRHAVVGVWTVYVIIIIVVAASIVGSDSGAGSVMWRPVERTALVTEVEIFHDSFFNDSVTRCCILQSPYTVPSIASSDAGSVFPRPFEVGAQLRAVGKPVAGLEIPGTERTAFV